MGEEAIGNLSIHPHVRRIVAGSPSAARLINIIIISSYYNKFIRLHSQHQYQKVDVTRPSSLANLFISISSSVPPICRQ
jgi:hypothetical protein